MLEENRDLLNDITSKENCKEGAAQIPKLIFDLVSQADKKSDDVENMNESPPDSSTADECDVDAATTVVADKVTSAQEISHNLPKVWRVLIELLNHQQLKPVPLKVRHFYTFLSLFFCSICDTFRFVRFHFPQGTQQELCYKSIQTETGPQMVLSVSKTFIRLKDLIMEKKFLQKETKKLKNLNTHLESRLGEQEQRLGAVTIELNKTWNLVGRMQRQHRQLHTHEQVLRYQLQQKRRMLNELKEELEYCRRKWALAKEKNTESQMQWESMRLEFRQRKENDLNNSGESGYSDGPASEEDDDDDVDDDDDGGASASVSIVSSESSRNSRIKKKINIEKFLLTTEQIDRKALRIHSVSPARTARMSLARRNSDSQITTHFATEVLQASTDVVEPLVQLVCTECGESCAKHSVHFGDSDAAANRPAATEQAQVTEPIVCGGAKPKLTNAQKLVEAKASTSKTKMCCEIRKTATPTTTTTTATKVKAEESLEEMFFRLSGSSEADTTPCQSSQSNDEIVTAETAEQQHQQQQQDRAAQKLAQIEKLEVQCKQLMAQVMRASNRGDELNKRADTAHNKFKLNCNLDTNQQKGAAVGEPSATTSTVLDEPEISTSISQHQTKTDEQCLTATEQAYLARRDARLKRLEAESQAHLNRMKSMQSRAASTDIKMDSLRKRAGDAKLALAKVEAKFNNIAATISIQKSQSTSEAIEQSQMDPCTGSPDPNHQAVASVDIKLDAVLSEPSTSSSSSKTDDHCLTASEREYLARRDERLNRLEAEANHYMNLVKSTNRRAVDVDTKLEFLHGRYDGESDVAGATTTQQVNESQIAISNEQSTYNSETNDHPTNDEPPNQHDHNETDHSPSEIAPNTNTNEDNAENPAD